MVLPHVTRPHDVYKTSNVRVNVVYMFGPTKLNRRSYFYGKTTRARNWSVELPSNEQNECMSERSWSHHSCCPNSVSMNAENDVMWQEEMRTYLKHRQAAVLKKKYTYWPNNAINCSLKNDHRVKATWRPQQKDNNELQQTYFREGRCAVR